MNEQSETSIRAFMAARSEPALQARLARLQEKLNRTGAEVRWVRPQNIHLTLLFLGDLDRTLLEPLADEMGRAALSFRPFTLDVEGIGVFGRASKPRVIWTGLSGATQELERLHKRLLAAALALGCRPDEKQLVPHLTLGRIKTVRDPGALLKAIELEKETCFGQLAVSQFLLFQSRLRPTGPEYSVLRECSFSAGNLRE